jgi:hypothetical protein
MQLCLLGRPVEPGDDAEFYSEIIFAAVPQHSRMHCCGEKLLALPRICIDSFLQ